MSIWPTEFAQNSSDIKGISPLPILWVIGEKETGKSTFVATVDPVRPGNKSRTLVTDLEMSYNTIETQSPLDVLNIRAMTRDKIGKDYTFKDLFTVWREAVLNIKPGEYSVLGVDPVSDLFQGAFMWIGDNSALFGKTPQRYNGEMGVKSQWGDTALYWKQLSLELAQRFETTVFVSHTKDIYHDNRRTGQKGARGADFTEIASLVLWLDYTDGKRSAVVKKSRLSWWDWSDTTKTRPIVRELLPKRLVPEYSGQPYPELISKYMANPQADYGELNIVTVDPSVEIVSEEEKTQLNLELTQEQVKLKIAEGRAELFKSLIDGGYYESKQAISEAAKSVGIIYTIEDHDKIYKELVDLVGEK